MSDATLQPYADLKNIGGYLCLDLTNTVDWRGTASEEDRLASYGDFLVWAEGFGVLSAEDRETLGEAAQRSPDDEGTALLMIRCLREAMYRICSDLAAGAERPDSADLAEVNRFSRRLCSRLVVGGVGDETLSWDIGPDDLLSPLSPVLWSLVDLLRGGEVRKLRECANDSCHWLFVDRSRNRSRRWCAMWNCGNRAKGRRFYHAHKETAHEKNK